MLYYGQRLVQTITHKYLPKTKILSLIIKIIKFEPEVPKKIKAILILTQTIKTATYPNKTKCPSLQSCLWRHFLKYSIDKLANKKSKLKVIKSHKMDLQGKWF